MMFVTGLLYLALLSSGQRHEIPTDPKSNPSDPQFDRGAPNDTRFHKSQADLDYARRVFNEFAHCTASLHQKQAAAALGLSYESAPQAKATQALVDVERGCFGPISGTVTVEFDPGALVAGMAEYFVLHPQAIDEQRRRNPASFNWPAPNGLEQFGECVVGQDEQAVRSLIATRVASDAEQTAAQALAPAISQCVAEGQTLSLNVGTVRELLAFSLYRHIAAPPPAAVAAAPVAAH